jgi:pilus assembly protein CpaF
MTSSSLADRWSSPLEQIERAVQERAKGISLDMAGPDGLDKLGALIHDEVSRWSDDFKRGKRDFDLADPDRLADRAFRNLAGYGPLEPLLNDDDVWEIMVNAPDAIFVKRHAGPSGYHDEVFHDDEHVLRTLTKILDDATASHRKLDASEGLQDAQLDTGARLHVVHGDVGRDGHVLVNIRKFTGVAFKTLDELVERDMFDDGVADFLRACVRARLSMVFAGAPGSGKTTMLSCCAAELDPRLRVVVAEEVFETDVPLPNVAHMQTRPARTDRKEVDLRRLVAGFLRMAPDVAIVGEVRDKEPLPDFRAHGRDYREFLEDQVPDAEATSRRIAIATVPTHPSRRHSDVTNTHRGPIAYATAASATVAGPSGEHSRRMQSSDRCPVYRLTASQARVSTSPTRPQRQLSNAVARGATRH